MNVDPVESCCTMQVLGYMQGWNKREMETWWGDQWKRISSPDCATLAMVTLKSKTEIKFLKSKGFDLVSSYPTDRQHGRYKVGVFIRQPERVLNGRGR